LHFHLAISDRKGLIKGGHVANGCIIFTNAEIEIGVFNNTIYQREQDENAGVYELIVKTLK